MNLQYDLFIEFKSIYWSSTYDQGSLKKPLKYCTWMSRPWRTWRWHFRLTIFLEKTWSTWRTWSFWNIFWKKIYNIIYFYLVIKNLVIKKQVFTSIYFQNKNIINLIRNKCFNFYIKLNYFLFFCFFCFFPICFWQFLFNAKRREKSIWPATRVK